jgi:hypothetical protein
MLMNYSEVESNLADKPLEGKLPDKKLGRFLVPPNLTKSSGSGSEATRFLGSKDNRRRGRLDKRYHERQ